MKKKTWTKKELVHEISEKFQQDSNLVRVVIQDFLDRIREKLSMGERLEFRDFGVFDVVERKEKIGRNPKTGVEVKIPKHLAVKFTAGKEMTQKMGELTKNHPGLLNKPTV
jgi:nucleoid DNA-binding protein